MYAAVTYRTREIATLRVLGFKRRSILLSFLMESLLVALTGGVLGCLLALPINLLTTGTTNFQTFSEVAFAFRTSPGLLLHGNGLCPPDRPLRVASSRHEGCQANTCDGPAQRLIRPGSQS